MNEGENDKTPHTSPHKDHYRFMGNSVGAVTLEVVKKYIEDQKGI